MEGIEELKELLVGNHASDNDFKVRDDYAKLCKSNLI